jgi:hypothetical protein
VAVQHTLLGQTAHGRHHRGIGDVALLRELAMHLLHSAALILPDGLHDLGFERTQHFDQAILGGAEPEAHVEWHGIELLSNGVSADSLILWMFE